MTHKSRTDRRRVSKLGSNVDHVTHFAQQLFEVKKSKVKVTKSRHVSADKNAITRQCMVISTSNLVGIIDVVVNVKRCQIAEILHSNRKSGSANRTAVSKFTPEVHK